jgi:phosphatidylglycerol:prolipoprotein diacylglycerol transferase
MRSLGLALEMLHVRGRGLPLWAAFQGLAVLLALAWFWRRCLRTHARLLPCLVIAFGGAALGAAALGVVVRLPAWVRSGFEMSVLRGGVVAYGALAGLALSFAWLARFRGVSAALALDCLAPCLGLLVVCGRLGCFFAGCDFGTVTHVPWAVRFPAPGPAFMDHVARGLVLATDRRSLPVHPTQLYEAALGIAVIGLALAAGRRSRRRGAAFWTAAAVYAAGRWVLDYFRGDTEASAWGPLPASQWLSALVLVAAAAWATSKWRSGSSSGARSDAPASPLSETGDPAANQL